MRLLRQVGWLLALSACGSPALPGLPTVDDNAPGSLTWVSLATASDGLEVDPNAIIAGQALRLKLAVRSRGGSLLRGVETAFSLQTENFADLLRFPEGDRCISDREGICSVVLVSRGGAGPFTLSARIAADEPVEAAYDFLVIANAEQAQITVDVDTMGTFEWEPGQADPLAVDGRLLKLDVNEADGRMVSVRLLDDYGNPLTNRMVRLSLRGGDEPIADAGPSDGPGDAAGDSGRGDWGVLDAAPSDAQPSDAAAADQGLRDAGITDTPVTDSPGRGDGGGNKPLNTLGEVGPVQVISSQGSCEAVPGALDLNRVAAQPTDASGVARFCVQPKGLTGDWQVDIDPSGFFTAPNGNTVMRLSGRTLAGLPTQMVWIDPPEPEPGQPAPRLGCPAGGETPAARLRVINAIGFGVPDERVFFDAVGGLDGLSSRVQVTDANGEVTVEAICPARALTAGKIVARLPGYDVEPAELGVEVRAGNVARVEIIPFGSWPASIVSGTELTVRVRAYDVYGLPVLREGIAPEGDQADTRPPLRFAFDLASVGHAETLWRLGADAPLITETVAIDPEIGAAELSFRVTSRATYSNPIQLRAQPLGNDVSAQVSINVAPGAPVALAVSPAGVVEAMLGGAAGELVFTALDSDEIGANAVPNVPITLTAPTSLVLAGNWINEQTLQGRTGPDGRFRATVVQAQVEGDAQVTGRILVADQPVEASTVVRVGSGEAAALSVRLGGETLETVDGLASLTMRAGTALTDVLTLQLVNANGAGLAGRGLSIDLESGDPQTCARFEEAGVTDEQGSIRYGAGHLELRAGGAVGVCVYRLAHGMTPANTRLRIAQIAGLPRTAVLTAQEVRILANYEQRPNAWNNQVALRVTLQALDENNLPPAGLRMWLDAINCHVSSAAMTLDQAGSASFWVAGGAAEGEDCRLRPRYLRERDDYQTRAVNGRPARDGETAEQVALRNELILQTSGFAAANLDDFAFSGKQLVMTAPDAAHEWAISARGLVYPLELANGFCATFETCSYVQLVAMEFNHHDDLVVRMGENGQPVILRDQVPLHYTFGERGTVSVELRIIEGWLGAGRWVGVRIKQPGDNGAASRALPFYAQPPVRWTGLRPGGAGGTLSIERPNGAEGRAVITGGWRQQLHGDETPELVLCGTDDAGGWFSVVHLDEHGALPASTQAAQRSWLGDAPSPYDARFACAIADLDNDQRPDLVLLASPRDGYPRVVIHRGTGDASVFRAQGEEVVWRERSLRAATPRSLQLRIGPPRVQVCVAPALEDGECPEGDGRSLSLDMTSQPAQPTLVQTQAAVLGQRKHVALSTGAVVLPDGQVDQGWRSFEIRGRELAYATFSPSGEKFVSRAYVGSLHHTATTEISADRFTPSYRSGYLATNFPRQIWSPDGREFAAVSRGFVTIRNLQGAVTRRLETGCGAVNNGAYAIYAWSRSNHFVQQCGSAVSIFNALTGRHTRSLNPNNENNIYHVKQMMWSADGRALAIKSATRNYVSGSPITASDRGEVAIYHGADLASVRTLDRNHQAMWLSDDGQSVWIRRAGEWQQRRLSDWSLLRSEQQAQVDIVHWMRPDKAYWIGSDGPRGLAIYARASSAPLWRLPSSSNYYTSADVSSAARIMTVEGGVTAPITNTVRLMDRRDDGGWGTPRVSQIGTLLPGQDQRTDWRGVVTFSGSAVSLQRPYTWRQHCGDGIIDDGEQFDVGQPWGADELLANCGATCGDGVRQDGEVCDDANANNDDGCLTTCQNHRCGDGLVRNDLEPGDEDFETCDDGNLRNDDACSSICQAHRCGDGLVRQDLQEGEPGFEPCDDGNDAQTDACLSSCQLAACGDGVVRARFEGCDDGNQNNGDGCSSECLPEGLNTDLGSIQFCGFGYASNEALVGVYNSRRNPLERHPDYDNWDDFCRANGWLRSNTGDGNFNHDCATVMTYWRRNGVADGTGQNATLYPPNRPAGSHVYHTCIGGR